MEETQPAFTVVIPTYNRVELLPRAIHSVMAQTHQEFELIIVDDGSRDGTEALVTSINNERVRYISQENQGVSVARNTGARLASAPLVTFLDSDDEVSPEWLATLALGFQNDKVGFVCVGGTIRHGHDTESIRLPSNLGPVYWNMTGLFLPGTYAMRYNLVVEIGGFIPELAYSENTDLALRLTAYCAMNGWHGHSIEKPLVVYHRQPGRWLENESRILQRLASAEYFLRVHGQRYRRLHPRGYANYCAIAGVSCMRLGQYEQGRRYFVMAIGTNPTNWRHYARILMGVIPRIGMRYWQRALARED